MSELAAVDGGFLSPVGRAPVLVGSGISSLEPTRTWGYRVTAHTCGHTHDQAATDTRPTQHAHESIKGSETN